MKGEAYLFRRRSGAMNLGHIGWGFLLDPRQKLYCFGSTENPTGNAYVAPGENNGAWVAVGTFQQMLHTMKRGAQGAPPYDDYKRILVDSINPKKAHQVAESKKNVGYRVAGLPGSNCADHAYDILAAYGVQGLILLQAVPGPNGWFDAHIFGWEYLGDC